MADLKITDLGNLATLTATDLFPVVDDVAGTPITRKLAASVAKTYMSDTPTLVTPVLGVATATSINKVTITQPATTATLTIVEGGSLITAGAYATTLTSTAATGVTLPTTGTLATLAGTETLSGKTLTTPNVGVATATTVNKVTITAPTTAATLTLIQGSTLETAGAFINKQTTTANTDITLPTTGTLATLTGSETLTNKTLTTPALGAATATSVAATSWMTYGLKGNVGAAPTVASATTIAPTTAVVLVSGVTTIETITAPAPIATVGGTIIIIPTGVFLTGVTGNIALATTSVVSKALHMTYDPTTVKWYPSY